MSRRRSARAAAMPPSKRARTTLEIAADIATLYMDSRDEFIKNAVRGRGLKDAIAQFEKDGGEPFRGDSAYNKLSALATAVLRSEDLKPTEDQQGDPTATVRCPLCLLRTTVLN
jgi:hypothetical protein